MPDWSRVLREISAAQADQQVRVESGFDRVRRRYLRALARHTRRNIIAYYSAFLSKPRIEGIEITDEDKNGFMLCMHKLDRSKGLDLIIHTPGGNVAATESLVDYLRQMFGKDIRAIVPQIAMSAGTMLALSCKQIIMAKHSNIGPVDPQIGAIPALAVIFEINKAYEEIKRDQRAALVWSPILSRLTPSFVTQCEWAVERSKDFLKDTLSDNMFSDLPYADREIKIGIIVEKLGNIKSNNGHSKHFHIDACKDLHLNVLALEDDQRLQDLVLTVHHCYMHSLGNSPVIKIIENHSGKAIIKQQNQIQVMPVPSSS